MLRRRRTGVSATMFKRTKYSESQAKLDALDRSLAIIELSMDGQVIHANENFLKLMKYSLGDVAGKPHRIFVEDEHANADEYAAFWNKLKGGHHITGEFLRLAKDG